MPHLILIRHSEVARESLGPDTDWPLSPHGRDLCVALADALRDYKPRIIVTSPMRRAEETARLTAERLGIPWRTAEGLEEHRRPFVVPSGLLPDTDFQATMRRFFTSPGERVFGDELADECRDRFAAAIDAVLTSEPDRNVAIVSHGTALALYAAPFFDLAPVDLWSRIGWPAFMVVDPITGTGLHLAESVLAEEK